MSPLLHFPDAKIMTEILDSKLVTKVVYYEEITKAIEDLAVERFANSSKDETTINQEVERIILDIQTGTDSLKKKKLPEFGLKLPEFMWDIFTRLTQLALLECAKKT